MVVKVIRKRHCKQPQLLDATVFADPDLWCAGFVAGWLAGGALQSLSFDSTVVPQSIWLHDQQWHSCVFKCPSICDCRNTYLFRLLLPMLERVDLAAILVCLSV